MGSPCVPKRESAASWCQRAASVGNGSSTACCGSCSCRQPVREVAVVGREAGEHEIGLERAQHVVGIAHLPPHRGLEQRHHPRRKHIGQRALVGDGARPLDLGRSRGADEGEGARGRLRARGVRGSRGFQREGEGPAARSAPAARPHWPAGRRDPRSAAPDPRWRPTSRGTREGTPAPPPPWRAPRPPPSRARASGAAPPPPGRGDRARLPGRSPSPEDRAGNRSVSRPAPGGGGAGALRPKAPARSPSIRSMGEPSCVAEVK